MSALQVIGVIGYSFPVVAIDVFTCCEGLQVLRSFPPVPFIVLNAWWKHALEIHYRAAIPAIFCHFCHRFFHKRTTRRWCFDTVLLYIK